MKRTTHYLSLSYYMYRYYNVIKYCIHWRCVYIYMYTHIHTLDIKRKTQIQTKSGPAGPLDLCLYFQYINHKYIHTYIHVHVHIHTYMYIHTYIHIHTYLYIHIYTYILYYTCIFKIHTHYQYSGTSLFIPSSPKRGHRCLRILFII